MRITMLKRNAKIENTEENSNSYFRRTSSPAEIEKQRETLREEGYFCSSMGGETVISVKGWSKKRHNVWHSTLRQEDLFRVMGYTSDYLRIRWMIECKKTFQNIQLLPEPVSASEIAKRWGVCHTTAKKLIIRDWEWEFVGTKHFIHCSYFNERNGVLLRKCLKTKNPIASVRAVNKLIEIDILPVKEELVKIIGRREFQILVESRILKSIKPLFGIKKRIYFLSTE